MLLGCRSSLLIFCTRTSSRSLARRSSGATSVDVVVVVVSAVVVVANDAAVGNGLRDTGAGAACAEHAATTRRGTVSANRFSRTIALKAMAVSLDGGDYRWWNVAMTEQATFTSMDTSTREEWMTIGAETARNQPRVAETVLGLLRSLEHIVDGFATDQLTHALQTATLAERAGADDEVVVAALCHDIGKAISVPNHPAIAAAILRPYVRPEVHFMIEAHQDFQGKHYYEHFGMDPNARDKYRDNPAYELAQRFADEWDQRAFDPNYDTLPLEHFEEKVRRVFAKPRSIVPQ